MQKLVVKRAILNPYRIKESVVVAKIMVFQHVPYEPLGTLDPLLRAQKHRIRYVNFGRNPKAQPDISGYEALIILGGPMNIGQESDYPHLETEKSVIKEAIKLNIPILGICLGAQLIASALGAPVYPATVNEIGWCQLNATKAGQTNPVVNLFTESQKIFQWHGYTFDLPQGAELLVTGEEVTNQAFRYGSNVYGFQFHLEANLPLIQRWLQLPQHQDELAKVTSGDTKETIWAETLYQIDKSLKTSKKVFGSFLSLLPEVNETYRFSHRQFPNEQ